MDTVPSPDSASSNGTIQEINLESHYWRRTPVTGSVPVPRHAFASALYKDKYIIIGGYGQGGAYLADSWALDLESKEWTYFSTRLSTQIPVGWLLPPMHSAAFALCGSNLYAFGGITQKGVHLGSLLVLDLETAAWSCLEPPVSPRARWGSSLVEFGGSLYCFGGFGDVFYSDLWKFDPVTGSWTELQPLGVPPPRHYHTATVFNGHMYIIGGYRGSVFTADVWAYEFATNRWLKITGANRLSNRRGHTTVLIPHRASCLVFGGRDDRKRLNDIIEFSFENHTFQTLRSAGDSPESRIFHSAFLHKHSMFAFGGLNIYNTNELLEYVIEADPTLAKGSRIDYAPLWKSQFMSDVTFEVSPFSGTSTSASSSSTSVPSDPTTLSPGGKIHAHKLILYSASEHFRTLFNVGMRESKEGVIKIDDMSLETLEEVLHFIYTGKIHHLTSANVLDLLGAADKFMLTEMVDLVQRALSFILSGDNIASILATASRIPTAKATFQLCVTFLRDNPLHPSFSQCKRVLKQVDEAIYHELRTLRRQESDKQQRATPTSSSPSTPPPSRAAPLTDSKK